MPHCTRHTCISMLSEAGVQETTIKKIVGHSKAMTLTEKVYTHYDMQILIDAINQTLDGTVKKIRIKKRTLLSIRHHLCRTKKCPLFRRYFCCEIIHSVHSAARNPLRFFRVAGVRPVTNATKKVVGK